MCEAQTVAEKIFRCFIIFFIVVWRHPTFTDNFPCGVHISQGSNIRRHPAFKDNYRCGEHSSLGSNGRFRLRFLVSVQSIDNLGLNVGPVGLLYNRRRENCHKLLGPEHPGSVSDPSLKGMSCQLVSDDQTAFSLEARRPGSDRKFVQDSVSLRHSRTIFVHNARLTVSKFEDI